MNKNIEKMSDTPENIKEEIEKIYKADVESIRNLGLISKELMDGGLEIPGNVMIKDNLTVDNNITSNNITSNNITSNTVYFGSTTYELKLTTGNYATVQTSGRKRGWGGYSVDGKWNLMANDSECGIYNDMNNKWLMKWFKHGSGGSPGQGGGEIYGGLKVNGYNVEKVPNSVAWWGTESSNKMPQHGNPATRFSIYCTHGLRGYRFVVASDRRIKNNIDYLNNIDSLNIFRKIKPCKYNEKDKDNGFRKHYGFIAQDINEILPECVNITNDTIPNIQITASVTKVNDKEYKLILEKNIDIILNTNSILILKTPSINEIKTQVLSHIDNTIVVKDIDDTIKNLTRVLVYGQYVNDFKNLEKDQIYTIAISALQEVDCQLQKEKTKTSMLQTQYDNLLLRVQALENKVVV